MVSSSAVDMINRILKSYGRLITQRGKVIPYPVGSFLKCSLLAAVMAESNFGFKAMGSGQHCGLLSICLKCINSNGVQPSPCFRRQHLDLSCTCQGGRCSGVHNVNT